MSDFAVFTICKDEKTFLPIWLKYYSQFVDMKDIYVLDHESTDGSTDNLPCNKIVVHNELAFDHAWVTETVKSFQRELLQSYENVMLTEIDEIVFAREGLDNYVKRFSKPAVKCNGYDLIHMPEEPGVDLLRPILSQRKYWFQNHLFQAKPYLSKVPLNWTYGYHGADGVSEIDPELYLIHLNRFDYELAYQRNLERQAMKLHQGDKAAGFGFQKHLQGEEYRDWFYNFRQESPIKEIPKWIREMEIV